MLREGAHSGCRPQLQIPEVHLTLIQGSSRSVQPTHFHDSVPCLAVPRLSWVCACMPMGSGHVVMVIIFHVILRHRLNCSLPHLTACALYMHTRRSWKPGRSTSTQHIIKWHLWASASVSSCFSWKQQMEASGWCWGRDRTLDHSN